MSSLFQIGHSFWWQPTTTRAPETIIKHVPLTYFRTYTYQPLAGNPFSYPFLGGAGVGGAAGFGSPQLGAQSPLLAGSRYETYNGGGYLPIAPSSTTTTSTTTTTKAPPPPPPTTTTSTTTTTTTPTPTQTANTFAQGMSQMSHYSADYPTYNRRMYSTGYNPAPSHFRPSYPYPDYSTVNLATLKLASSIGERLSPSVQFVPCMCPITVDLVNGLDRKNGGSSIFAETRSGSEEDDDLDIPLEKTKVVIEKDADGSSESGESKEDELQPRNKIDSATHEKLSNVQSLNSDVDSSGF